MYIQLRKLAPISIQIDNFTIFKGVLMLKRVKHPFTISTSDDFRPIKLYLPSRYVLTHR